MKLYIAEKPSMAKEIAACLPAPHNNKDGFIETSAGLVTWCYGHVLRAAQPHEYDIKYKNWNVDDLPIIPESWKLVITDSCKKQFTVIKGLIKKADEIIHAGDPDREGQLLVDELLDYLDFKKPVKRLLLNALDERTINKALGNLQDNKNFENLKYSALARSRADWLIGMNMSRAFSLAAQKNGHSKTFPIGRVKTPTIALVVRRENEINNFKPLNYYSVVSMFKKEQSGLVFPATWMPKDNQRGLDSEGRLISGDIAGDLKALLYSDKNSKAIIMAHQSADEKEPPPLPYSLSALQIAAGKKYGYDPQVVLDTAQSLYEKKLTSYPRSDCQYLPENLFSDSENIFKNLSHMAANSELVKLATSGASLHIKSRAWNDAKITSHHAIIPTINFCDLGRVSDTEINIYFLIAQSFIAQFYPNYDYKKSVSDIAFAGEIFRATGKINLKLGWKNIFIGKNALDEDDKAAPETAILPTDLKPGDELLFDSANVVKKTTTSPKRYTASSLVQAMKSIHLHVKNDDLKKRLKDANGIGTEATRANIIADIIKKGFILQDKKHLFPSEEAYSLIAALPDELTYPDTTATWEMSFDKILSGNGSLDNFMQEQRSFVDHICRLARTTLVENSRVIYCPACHEGKLIKRTWKEKDFWGCTRYPECTVWYHDKDGEPQVK